MSIQAMKQALEALEEADIKCNFICYEAKIALRAAIEAAERQEPVAWEGAEEWEQLAYELCAEEHGEECCNDLLWSGGVIPEPWGERWLKYEDEAKRMISLVRKFTTPQPAPDGCKNDAARWNFVMTTEPYALNLWNALPKNIYQQERHLNNAIDQAMLAAAPKPEGMK